MVALLLKRKGLTLMRFIGDGNEKRSDERVKKRGSPGLSVRLSCWIPSRTVSGRAVLCVRLEVVMGALLTKGSLGYRLGVRCLRRF